SKFDRKRERNFPSSCRRPFALNCRGAKRPSCPCIAKDLISCFQSRGTGSQERIAATMTRHAFLGVLATFLILSGCETPRAVLWHGPNSSPQSVAAADAATVKPAKPAAVVPIYVATSRQRSNDFSQPYNSNRSKTLNFAQVDVGIPAAHVKGQVESTGYKPDPARNFAATAFQPYDNAEQFLAQLNAALAKQGPRDREILIFVHGYNNNFADSTFRTAQFVHDYKMKSVAVE